MRFIGARYGLRRLLAVRFARLVLALLVGGSAARAEPAAAEAQMVLTIGAALAGDAAALQVVATLPSLTHVAVDLDGPHPLRVDLLVRADVSPKRAIYMLPGGGLNFRAAYTLPRAEGGLARFLCDAGYLVIGITPREDGVPFAVPDRAMMADWGIARHREDIRRVVERVQALSRLPYEVLGHSYGAVSALDYASRFADELERLVVLDIYAFDPARAPRAVRQAEQTARAHVRLMQRGVLADETYAATGPLLHKARVRPREASGTTRLFFGHSGEFTNEGLLAFSFLESNALPGVHTFESLLPGDWPMRGGYFAGRYRFAANPADDTYAFAHVAPGLLGELGEVFGSGLIPMAFARDYWSVVGMTGDYAIDWKSIRCPLVWLNSAYGYGDQAYGAELIRRAGNADVTVGVVPGYGHADMLWGARASQDVWQQLVPGAKRAP